MKTRESITFMTGFQIWMEADTKFSSGNKTCFDGPEEEVLLNAPWLAILSSWVSDPARKQIPLVCSLRRSRIMWQFYRCKTLGGADKKLPKPA